MSSKNSNKLPAWDLSDMYKGIDDPKIGAIWKNSEKKTRFLLPKNIKASWLG